MLSLYKHYINAPQYIFEDAFISKYLPGLVLIYSKSIAILYPYIWKQCKKALTTRPHDPCDLVHVIVSKNLLLIGLNDIDVYIRTAFAFLCSNSHFLHVHHEATSGMSLTIMVKVTHHIGDRKYDSFDV